jgi:hypothetical protein
MDTTCHIETLKAKVINTNGTYFTKKKTTTESKHFYGTLELYQTYREGLAFGHVFGENYMSWFGMLSF